MDHGMLPAGTSLVRTTDEFTASTVPAGLRRAHRVAEGVWGRLRVLDGHLRFVWEPAGDRPDGGGGVDDRSTEPLDLVAGDSVVIPPGMHHHVEPGDDARFLVEFHR